MKKQAIIVFLLLFTTNTSVCAEEIQMSDFVFEQAKPLLDGYNYVAYTNEFKDNVREFQYDNIETNIIMPNGEMLLAPASYNILYKSTYEGFFFPQSESGNLFMIHSLVEPYTNISINEVQGAFVDSNGNIITDFGSVSFCENRKYVRFFKDDNYLSMTEGKKRIEYICTETEEKFNIVADKNIYYDVDCLYNDETDEFAVVYIEQNKTIDIGIVIDVDFYQSFKKVSSYKGKVHLNDKNYEYFNDVLFYNGTELLYGGKKFLRMEGNEVFKFDFLGNDNSYIKMNSQTEESKSERVDKSYIFKEKEINGTKYYALFKELQIGETALDFTPTEKPAERYAKNINKMAADKLLFNNELCFFDKGITKLDFGIVLGRALCTATGYNIDNFTSSTNYVDVNQPYCLLLADNGILTSDSDLYINEKAISQTTVLDSLDNAAKKYGVLSKWNSVKEIGVSDRECTRELAYSETYKLYNIIKDRPNIDIDTDFRNQSVDVFKIIYISILSTLILVFGAYFNDMLTKKC